MHAKEYLKKGMVIVISTSLCILVRLMLCYVLLMIFKFRVGFTLFFFGLLSKCLKW